MGMDKAGLVSVGQLSFRSEGGVGLVPIGDSERAQAGAKLLGVLLVQKELTLAPCWSCGSAAPASLSPVDAAGYGCGETNKSQCSCAVELKTGKIGFVEKKLFWANGK